MKHISANDLSLIPSLSHFNQFDILNPANDCVVNPVLYEMGFAIDLGLCYTVAHHRRLTGEVCTGFLILGEVRTDREFRLSPWCSVEDRMICAGKTDISLARELAGMSGVSQSQYGGSFAPEDEEMNELHQDLDDIERIEAEMEALGIVLEAVRGNQHRKDGSRKRPIDYHQEEAYDKPRKRKENRTTLKHREAKRNQL